jgi:hypothetical protein
VVSQCTSNNVSRWKRLAFVKKNTLTIPSIMIARVRFLMMLFTIVLGFVSSQETSIRGRKQGPVLAVPKFVCPTETPRNGSHCNVPVEITCYFNFVKSPGTSPNESNFVPSISCSCSLEGQWECTVAPEYLMALVYATSW